MITPRKLPSKNDGAVRLLSRADERQLALRIRRSDDTEALARLVLANRGLVGYFARPLRRHAQSWDDLMQEGNVGLVIAARRFDPDRGTRFATYAQFWIRASMLAYLFRTRGAVRFGTSKAERHVFFWLGRACQKLAAETGVVDREALARELGVRESVLEMMTPRIGGYDFSLDAPARRQGTWSFSAALADTRASPEECVEAAELERVRHRQLARAIATLKPRERSIIRARYLRAQQVTLRTLGYRMGITRERVRQIESRAKLKLRQRMRDAAEVKSAFSINASETSS